MNIESLKNHIPDYAKDIRLNLNAILTEEGAPGLSAKEIMMLALASAYATKNKIVIQAILIDAVNTLSETELNAVKSATAIMAMNNIYYRFIHMVSDSEFANLPAKLRMTVINQPGIDKIQFELLCLAVSAINGCGMCVDAHTNQLVKAEVNKLAIQSAIRIAAVISAVTQCEVIRNT